MIFLVQNTQTQTRTPNNIYIGQIKNSKFTKVNKQIFFMSAKQTFI